MNIRHFRILVFGLALWVQNAFADFAPSPFWQRTNGTTLSCLEQASFRAQEVFSPPAETFRAPASTNFLVHAFAPGGQTISAQLQLMRYCHAVIAGLPKATRLELGAKAIDAALDAHDLNDAHQVLELEDSSVFDEPNENEATQLKFGLARARVWSFLDKNKAAIEARVRSLDELDLVFGRLSKESITNLTRLADLELEIGDMPKAKAHISEAQSRLARVVPVDLTILYLTERAAAFALALEGRERDALARLGKLRATLEYALDSDDDWIASIDQSLEQFLMRLGENSAALEVASRLYVSKYQFGSGINANQIRPLWDLAYLYYENGRYQSAERITQALEEKFEKEPDAIQPQYKLLNLSLQAELESNRDNVLGEVEKRRAVLEGIEHAYGKQSVDYQNEAVNYARALRRLGRSEEGCSLLKTVAQALNLNGTGDSWTIEYVREQIIDCDYANSSPEEKNRLVAELGRAWIALAQHTGKSSERSLLALGRFAGLAYLAGNRSLAKQSLINFLALNEAARNESPEGALDRDDLLSRNVIGGIEAGSPIPRLGYRDLALLHAQDREFEDALRVAELARDRALGDRFAEQAWRRTRLSASERQQVDALSDRIQALDERIAVEADILARIRLESERTLALGERGRVEARLRAQRHLEPARFQPPKLEELRRTLAPDAALVSVLHSTHAWWALVIRAGVPVSFVEFADPDLGTMAAAWLGGLKGEPVRAWPLAGGRLAVQFTRPPDAAGPWIGAAAIGTRLGRAFFGPLAPALAGVRRLVVVGDDELAAVPLQALPLDAGLALDRYDIGYAPSLATYLRGQRPAGRGRAGHDLLAVGAVDVAPPALPASDDPQVLGLLQAAAHPLPYARREIDALARLFPAGRSTVWSGGDATKERLRGASRDDTLAAYRYVHFATHAWAVADPPEASAIVLAGATAERPAQGVLTAAELAGLRMAADLITLSACDTGSGRYDHGRGILGLAYASLAAGNRAALLSLWPVADDTTADFMQALYARLRRGIDPVRALALTQRAFRASADPRRADPATWAAFVLYGAVAPPTQPSS